MIWVLVFINFKFASAHRFPSFEEAHAFEHGINRGFTLAHGQGPILAAVLPEDEEQLAAIIPEGELELAREAIKP